MRASSKPLRRAVFGVTAVAIATITAQANADVKVHGATAEWKVPSDTAEWPDECVAHLILAVLNFPSRQ